MCHSGLIVVGLAGLALVGHASRVEAQERPQGLSQLASRLGLTGGGVDRWLQVLSVRGDAPPRERLLALTAAGERLWEGDGDGTSVRVDAELDLLLRQPGMAVVLIHNHPGNGGLSGADLGQLAKPGVAAIIAIGHDGSVFVASAGRRMDPDFVEARQHAAASAEVRRRLRTEWAGGRQPVAVAEAQFSHLVTLVLARAAVVEYWFALRGGSREAFERARPVFGRVVEGAAAHLRRTVIAQARVQPARGRSAPVETSRRPRADGDIARTVPVWPAGSWPPGLARR